MSLSLKFEIGDEVLLKGEKTKTFGSSLNEPGKVIKISKDKSGVQITAEYRREDAGDFGYQTHTVTMAEDFFLKADEYRFEDGVLLKKEDSNLKTHVLFILDKSGSMTSIEKEARDAFNEQLETIIEKEKNAKVTFTTFNNNIHVEFVEKDAREVKPRNKLNYQPSGTTAMLDAVGHTLDLVNKRDFDDGFKHRFLVIIISDGNENCSLDYSFEDIRKKIDGLKEEGNWTFTYMGANQNLDELSDMIAIPKDNMLEFEATSAGMRSASQTMNVKTMAYYDSNNLSTDSLFDEDEDGYRLKVDMNV